MNATGEEESRDRLAAIARMYYLDDLGQQDIASILGISRSQISRLLARAREQGIVRISVDDYDPRDRDLEAQLVERFGLHRAVVIHTGERSGEHVRRAVGYFAAPAIEELIHPHMTLGLAGGRTLAALVEQIKPRIDLRGVTVVQLMGNIGPTASDIDAIELSRTLAQRLGGAQYTISAPAIAQDRSARDLFLDHEHIRFVWHSFASLEVALVGIGTLEESAFIDRGVLSADDLADLRRAGAVGEICGRFFDSRGQECESAYRDRVISIDLERLRLCPDVVVVTNGPRRAAALRAALAGELVKALVIDDRGARALLSREELA